MPISQNRAIGFPRFIAAQALMAMHDRPIGIDASLAAKTWEEKVYRTQGSYSARSAVIGFTLAARLAGSELAISATNATPATAMR